MIFLNDYFHLDNRYWFVIIFLSVQSGSCLCMGGIGNCFCCSSGFARYRIPSGQGIE